MIKKFAVILSLFFITACSESQEDKVIAYCMDALNVYSKVTKEQCICFYNETDKKFSSTEIDKMVTSPAKRQEAELTKEGMMFLTIAHSSHCFE
ncbi:hypothetical protein M997_1819 [Proteus hauseri ATCC 700826]|uniref:Lipoprotein n=1 Tax=Proteus hauseri ATCC 700826 TaxID=1354271 RepID=A0AAJ3HTD2_PROHU|nr:hypothetical protein [Proteus hauseri]OAT47290.1 hypothetical protein M997_1819 [Proteus hauseri ATCC 700826]